MQLPPVNSPRVRRVQAAIEAACAVTRISLAKTENHMHNEGMVPSLALARLLVLYEDSAALKDDPDVYANCIFRPYAQSVGPGERDSAVLVDGVERTDFRVECDEIGQKIIFDLMTRHEAQNLQIIPRSRLPKSPGGETP